MADWKKIVLEGLDANLNQITASNGIQITNSLTLPTTTNADFKILVADSTTGDVKGEDQITVGAQGTDIVTFTTMSIGGTPTVSSSQADDILTLLTGSGNAPLSIEGTLSSDTLTFTVATHSREDVEDLASLLLSSSNLGTTDVHQDITINYTDSFVLPGTFSLTGSLPLVFGTTPGNEQNEVTLDTSVVTDNNGVEVSQSQANVTHFLNGDDVKFGDITASNADYYYDLGQGPELSEIAYNPLGTTTFAPHFHGGPGNISQTTDLQVHGFFGGYLSSYQIGNPGIASHMVYNYPLAAPGKWVSASALHIVNDAHMNSDLTMSGDFIFQGFQFGDRHVLTHDSGNLFGSGSMPTALANHHQFTGSLQLTGSGVTASLFTGDGSGLSNISSSALTNIGILSGSAQISASISGAFHFLAPTLRTASATDGTVSAITASGVTVTSGFSGLASGKQIFHFQESSSADFLDTIALNYIVSASTTDTSGSDITTTGNIGTADGVVTQTIALNISKSTDGSSVLAGGDRIMFGTSSNNDTLKTTITNLSGSIVGSVLGTVTEISAGNGISVTNGTGYDGTTVVNTTIDILLSGSEGNPTNNSVTYAIDDLDFYTTSNLSSSANKLALNPYINVTSVTASTGSFSALKVTDSSFLGNTEELTIQDNFILLNSDVEGGQGDNEDAGISINRGSSQDANLFWNEAVNRWSISLGNLQSGSSNDSLEGYSTKTAHPDSYLAVTTFNDQSPDLTIQNPLTNNPADGSDGVGNIHVNTNATEVWIYA